jgi:hypothetical protein
VVRFVERRREEAVPEQRHLLLERPAGVDHPVQPVGLVDVDLSGLFDVRVEAVEQVEVDVRLALRVQELLDGRLVPLRQGGLDLVAGGPEAGPPEQVRHQLDAREQLSWRVNRHRLLLSTTLDRIDRMNWMIIPSRASCSSCPIVRSSHTPGVRPGRPAERPA